MADYEKIYSCKDIYYSNNIPLILEKSGIVRNNENDLIFACLSFRNIGEYYFDKVVVNFLAYDENNNLVANIKDIIYDSDDMIPGSDFGSKKAINLYIKSCFRYEVVVSNVITKNGLEYKNESLSVMKKLEFNFDPISSDELYLKAYRSYLNDRASYIYQSNDYLWLCSCGKINLNSVSKCERCGINKEELSSLTETEINDKKVSIEESIRKEKEDEKKRLAEIKIKQEEDAEIERIAMEEVHKEQARIKEQKSLKNHKGLAIAVVAVALVTACGIGVTSYLNSDGYKIKQADKLVDSGDYLSAVKIYNSLDLTLEVNRKIDRANYLYACALASDKKYEESINLLKQLYKQGHNDSRIKLEEVIIDYANQMLDVKDYHGVICLTDSYVSKFDEVYKINKNANICYAKVHVSNGDISGALPFILKCIDDSGHLDKVVYSELNFVSDTLIARANELRDQGKYLDAIDLYIKERTLTKATDLNDDEILCVSKILKSDCTEFNNFDAIYKLLVENNYVNFSKTSADASKYIKDYLYYLQRTGMYERGVIFIIDNNYKADYSSNYSNLAISLLKDFNNKGDYKRGVDFAIEYGLDEDERFLPYYNNLLYAYLNKLDKEEKYDVIIKELDRMNCRANPKLESIYKNSKVKLNDLIYENTDESEIHSLINKYESKGEIAVAKQLKMNYAKDHLYKNDYNTVRYIAELVEEGYPGAKSLNDKLFTDEVIFKIFDINDNKEIVKSSIRPGEKIELRVYWTETNPYLSNERVKKVTYTVEGYAPKMITKNGGWYDVYTKEEIIDPHGLRRNYLKIYVSNSQAMIEGERYTFYDENNNLIDIIEMIWGE